MENYLPDGMAEATRLTREGRLAEATAAIQRALGGQLSPEMYSPLARPQTAQDGNEGPIETFSRVVDETVQPEASPQEPSQPDSYRRHLRRPPGPRRAHREAPSASPPFDTRFRAMPDPPAPDAGTLGGRFVERSFTNQFGTRGYKLYVPGGYVGQEVSLVVMLHGCTQGPDDFAAGTTMNKLAEDQTFLVAYPAQDFGANTSKCWNWFKAGDQERGRGEPSIIAGITCEVLGEYCVDPSRVYMAGMSAGGAMAAILGSAYPDLYAAIGVHSGLAPGAARDLSSAFAAMRGASPAARQGMTAASTGDSNRPAPAIVFHGDRDTTVHPRNADHLLAYYRAAASVGGVQGPAGRPAPESPVEVRQGPALGGHDYTCATHRDAGGQVFMEQWTVHGLGHAWSGGSASGSYTDPKGPDASAEMVRFFHQQPQQQ